MQYSIQRLSQCSESERFAVAHSEHEVVVGNSTKADLRLHVSFGLPEVCIRVRVEDTLCVVENFTGDPGLVFVNGQPVFGVAQLEDGDALQVGSDQFAVIVLREEALEAAASPEITVPEKLVEGTLQSDDEVHRVLKSRVINSAVVQHYPSDADWSDTEILDQLSGEHTGFLLANFRHAGLTVPGRDIAGDDLYESFPADIRRISSLHVIVIPNTIRMLEIYRELRNRDAGIWCVPEGHIGKCISDVKLCLAWFTRPTILGTVLGDSPPAFSEVLLRSFKLLIMSELNVGYPWSIYAKPETEFLLSADGKRVTTVQEQLPPAVI